MSLKAVIVAAGKSSRLYPRTLEYPKGLLMVNGIELINHSVNKLKSIGVDKIGIVTGYKSDQLETTLGGDYTYIFNPFYEFCNNLGSLWMAKDFVGSDDFVYLHGDIIYEESILVSSYEEFRSNNFPINLVVDYKKTDEEAMKVRVDSKNLLIESSKNIELSEADGEWTGISFFRNSKQLFSELQYELGKGDLNSYDTVCFSKMAEKGEEIFCSSTNNKNWTEIDFEEDYQNALKLFETNE